MYFPGPRLDAGQPRQTGRHPISEDKTYLEFDGVQNVVGSAIRSRYDLTS
jgi:hypothetical protein